MIDAEEDHAPLAEVFLRGRGQKEVVSSTALEAALRLAIRTAREQFPEIEVPEQAFVERLARAVPSEAGDPVAAVGELRAADLYLGMACELRNASALGKFEEQFLSALDPALAQVGASSTVIEDAKQRVRQKLFLPTKDRKPKIETYHGRGSLRSWVRVIAIRETLSILRAQKPTVSEEDDRLGQDLDDPEIDFLKATYREEFRTSFRDALASLTSRERTLLRLHHLERLTLDQLAVAFNVHRATVARWLARARQSTLERTRGGLIQRLSITPPGLESIMRLIQSRLDVSVARFLPQDEDASPDDDPPTTSDE